ncbi:GNAT family N-acetyltransferase [Zhouia spongiae]|uniref:GNAT family N-acetyltransferase n=1 Tax=Zhouia spongiae TaxID=2202721 RepID=A0ABY3YQF3_9FLAO|nr:GNAT family N-acetyltransferase [Zhouia spongiae]UNY99953.1 GNAT family N-acetyltransferase [Zhouia spongiae]
MNIEVTERPKEQDAKTISQGIIDFNNAKIPDLEPIEKEVKFFVFVRNKLDQVIGGVRATCFWNTLHIELLWLSEDCRGKGVGKDLMNATESFAKEKGCEKAFVETTSWQAKPFYEKVGYVHIATINDRPKGYASHYLTKDLI